VDTSRPPVKLPELDDVLPGTPRPPAVDDLPNLGGVAETRDDEQQSNDQLMDFLFGS
jgi:hypothetical protein